MSFASPLWALAALALIPLIAVYLLKVRPRRRPTTALFLWQRVVTERKATRLLHRLRDVLSMLILALAVLALVLAMMGPRVEGDERKDLLLLIDRSASMSARDGGRTRFDVATRAARDIVRALDGHQRVAIASVADEVAYHAHLTNDPRRLLEAIDAVAPSDMPLRIDTLAAAAPSGEWIDRYRVILISDGTLGGHDVPEHMELLKVGAAASVNGADVRGAGNVGIVAADMRPLPSDGGTLGLYVQFASTFDEPIETDLVVRRGETLMRVVPVTIAPGVNEPRVHTVRGEPGRWRVELDVDDALDRDNAAHLSVPPPRPVRVGVDAEARYFFEQGVLAFSGRGGPLALDRNEPEVVLAQHAPRGGDEPVIVFAPDGESPWWNRMGEALGGLVAREVVTDHPALRYVDLRTMDFTGARDVRVPPEALVLVESDAGVPLIWRMTVAGRPGVVVNIDPTRSDFFFSANFPALVHAAVTHLAGRSQPLASTYRPDEPLPVPGARDGEPSRVSTPAGEVFEVVGDHVSRVGEIGFFTIENASGTWYVGSTLNSLGETLLDNAHVEDTTAPLSRGWPPALWLIAFAVALLVGEELLYHRRKVG